MATLIISTQYMENYDVDGVSEEGYWKYKGGSDYKIVNIDLSNLNATTGNPFHSAFIDEICDIITYDNGMSREYVLDWFLVEDGYLSEYETRQIEGDERNFYHDHVIEKINGHWYRTRQFTGERGRWKYIDIWDSNAREWVCQKDKSFDIVYPAETMDAPKTFIGLGYHEPCEFDYVYRDKEEEELTHAGYAS